MNSFTLRALAESGDVPRSVAGMLFSAADKMDRLERVQKAAKRYCEAKSLAGMAVRMEDLRDAVKEAGR